MVDNSKEVAIFYSWQSDLPDETNRRAIRQALREASTAVENTFKDFGVSITLDEATRNLPGSPNIPKSILDKIEAADIFIADVSIINASSEEGRRFPNPNVVFELGYAVAHLGWGRVVMLLNTSFGQLNELPFDFDRHRASEYTLNNGASKNGKNSLVSLLRVAVESIITANPHRPAALKAVSPEERMRSRDIKNIRWILNTLHLPTLDQHVRESPHYLADKVLYFWEGFNGIMLSSLFHLYDEQLENEFRCLHSAWRDSISFDQYYNSNPNGSLYVFGNPGDALFSRNQQAAWDKIEKSNASIRAALDAILAIVRERFVEIDVEETNRAAYLDYVETMRKHSALLNEEDA